MRLGELESAAAAVREAQAAVDAIPDPRERADVLCQLARARVQGKLAQPEEAFRSARASLPDITDVRVRCEALLQIGETLRALGHEALGNSDVKEAVRWAGALPDPRERIGVLLSAAAQVGPQLRSQLYDEALATAGTLQQVEERFTWSLAIAGAASGASDNGRDWLEESFRTADAMADPVVRAPYLVAGAEHQVKRGSFEKALRMAQRAGVAAQLLVPGDATPLLARAAVIQHLAGATQLARQTLQAAWDMAARATEEPARSQAQCTVVKGWLDVQGFAAAAACATAVTNAEMHVFALWMLAQSLVEAGRVEEAVSLLEEALDLCSGIPELGDRAAAIVMITDAYSAGQPFDARSAYDRLSQRHRRMVDVGGPESSTGDGDTVLDQLTELITCAMAAVHRGDLTAAREGLGDARQTAGRIAEPAERSGYQAMLSWLAQQQGMPELAATIIDACLEDPPGTRATLDHTLTQARVERAARLAGVMSTPGRTRWTAQLDQRIRHVQNPRILARVLLSVSDGDSRCRDELAGLHATVPAIPRTAPADRVLTLIIIARSQLRAGLAAAAQASLAAARGLAEEALSGEDRSLLLVAIHEARQMPVGVQDPAADQRVGESRAILLARVGAAHAAAGHPDEAAEAFTMARTTAGMLEPGVAAAVNGEVDRFAARERPAGEPEGPVGDHHVARAPGDGMDPGDPAGESAEHEAQEAVDAIARALLLADAERVVDLRWTIARIDRLSATGTGLGSHHRSDAKARESALRGASDLVASPADVRVSSGVEGAQRVMAAVQQSDGALVRVDHTQQAVLSVGGRQLLAAATLAADRDDRDGFEAYLVPCAYHPEIGAELLALVARVYPLQIPAVLAELHAALADQAR